MMWRGERQFLSKQPTPEEPVVVRPPAIAEAGQSSITTVAGARFYFLKTFLSTLPTAVNGISGTKLMVLGTL